MKNPSIDIKPVTPEERASWPTSVKVPLEQAFTDARGSIQPLVDLDMKSCVLIESKKGTVRANHYHRTDWHFCYVLDGLIEYYHRPQGSNEAPQKEVIRKGELFFTPPLVEHAMVFAQDTLFLTLGRNSREQAVYEADVVRVPPIEPQAT
jgi:quercetin dioxygenase-like cupin family protein